MDLTRVCDILNELLAAEAGSLLPRLTECTAFVPRSGADEAVAVERMASDHRAAVSRLARALIDLGGEPGPCVRDIASADFHYVGLEVLLPRVLAREQELASRCDGIVSHLSGCPDAASVVSDVATGHRVCAEQLRKLIGEVVQPG